MHRVAIYFAPRIGSPWSDFGARWLGRDAAGGAVADRIVAPGWSAQAWQALVAEPARYGWHATLKAPFRLADGVGLATVEAAVAALAARLPPVALGQLAVGHIGSDSAGFVALMPQSQPAAVGAIEAACVTELDHLRAPLTTAERDRRHAARLDARGGELLERYGYPYVLERFRFHLTLTGPITRANAASMLEFVQTWTAPLGQTEPIVVDRLCLFVEPAPGAPFHRRTDFVLSGGN